MKLLIFHVTSVHTSARHRRFIPHMVAVLKLEKCGILKRSLAQTLEFQTLITITLFLVEDPDGSP